MAVRTNDVKKGQKIKMRDGSLGTMRDSKKGNIRLVEVDLMGYPGRKDVGSTYAYEIVQAEVDGKWVELEHTKEQRMLAVKVARLGGL